jgi:intein/homing endonuclease
VKDPKIFAQGPQPPSPDEGISGNNNTLAKFAVGGSAFVGVGFIKTKTGRVWDKYLDTIRAVESGSPSGILKTFRTSEFYSPLESWSSLHISKPEMAVAGEYGTYLESVFGKSDSLSMTRTGAVFGEVRDSAGKLRGYGLNIELGGSKGSAIGDFYARLNGNEIGSLNDSILRAKYLAANTPQSYAAWLDDNIAANPAFAKQRAILGAQLRNEVSFLGAKFTLTDRTSRLLAKAETVGNLLRAKSATSVGRLNTLLKAPLEIPVLGDFLHKIPGIRSMSVKPGTTLGMLKGFATKALLAQGAWTGLEYLDYLRSENSIWSPALNTTVGAASGAFLAKQVGQKFSKSGLIAGAAIGLFTAVSPRFEKGLFHGTASVFTDAQIAGTTVSDSVGLTESVKSQEEVTPGFLKVGTALGFAGVGALGTSIYDYAGLVKQSAAKRFAGGKLGQIFEDTRKLTAGSFGENLWGSKLGESARRVVPGLNWLSKTRLGKSTAGIGALAGLAAWQVMASGLSLASGNFMAAIPGIGLLGSDKTTDELQDIYSGREEVAVRAGRWWEFGRSARYEGGRVQYYRPSAMARLEARAYQKGMWGSEEEKWEYSPFLHPLNALFGSDEWKYHYEQKYQYERPAPLCLHPETPVLTKQGYIDIQNISIGDLVYNKEGNWTKVIEVTSRDCYEKELVEINIASDNRSIKTTPNHKILAIKNTTSKRGDRCRDKQSIVIKSSLEWIEAKNLEKHDLVVIPKPFLMTKHTSYFDLGNSWPHAITENKLFLAHEIEQNTAEAIVSNLSTKEAAKKYNINHKRLWQLKYRNPTTINRFLPVDLDFAYFLGWYLAEGWLGDKQGKFNLPSDISFALHEDEQYVVDFLVGYTKKYFNSTVSVYKQSEHGICAKINSTVLATFIENLLGRTSAENKTIPDFVFKWSDKLKKQLVKGLTRGDGHYRGNRKKSKGEITFTSASSSLSANLRLLLLSLGIKSSFRKQNPNINWKPTIIKNRRIKPNTSFILSVSGPDYDLFSQFEEKINSNNSCSSQKGLLFNDFLYLPIRRIQKIPYNGAVYDLTVEETSSFLTTCIVHNSGTYGEDIPFIGSAVAATVGSLFKPRKEVRPEEWNLGDGQYLYHPGVRPEEEPAYELGGLAPGAPVAPGEGSQLFNRLNYQRREAIGLVGYGEQVQTEALLGREEVFANKETMATMGKETGSEYWLWKHLNLGGGAGSTETVRRFIPRTPSYLDTYNPLRNTMPSWIPENYFLDLKYGNPFEKLPEAELRLPGAGYCVHPNTRIYTTEGFKHAKDIEIGDVVLTSQGLKPILNIFSRYYDGPLVSIKSYGSLTEATKVTPQHEVKAIKINSCKYHLNADKCRRPCKPGSMCISLNCNNHVENKIEWTQSQNLEKGDYVVLPLLPDPNMEFTIDLPSVVCDETLTYEGDDNFTTWNYLKNTKRKNKQISCSLPNTSDIWYMFGLYIAEGSIGDASTKTGSINFALHRKESFVAEKIQSIFKGSFHPQNKHDPEANGYVYSVYNKVLGKYIKEIFGYSEYKKLPKNLSHLQFCWLLNGWLQGDSVLNKETYCLTISTRYSQLIKDILYYLTQYNIDSSVRIRPSRKVFDKKNKKDIDSKESYEITIHASSMHNFQLIGNKSIELSSSKTISNFILDGHRAFKIRDVEYEDYSGTVYDFEVEGTHEYTTSFIIHNSALHPEVEGLNPEDYPLAHKVKILGDVAMYSAEYKSYLSMAKRNIKQMSSEEARLVMQTEQQVKEKKKRREFQEYTFDESQLESEDVTVRDVLSPRRVLTEEYGDMVIDFKGVGSSIDEQSTERAKELLIGRTLRLYTPSIEGRKFDMVTSGPRMKAVPMLGGVDIGSIYETQGIAQSEELEDEFRQLRFSGNEKIAGKISETVLHGMENPMDYLTPASPVSKLIRQRSAVEEYVASEAIATSNAFWNKPLDHFITPASNLVARKMGDASIPEEVQERRSINEYFDMLKWTKYSRIEQAAKNAGDSTLAASAYDQKNTTVFGVDAYRNPTNILRALPRRERDFFSEFSGATSEEERAQILQLVPENEQRIYLAQWLSQSARAAQAKSEAGIATEEDNHTINLAQMARATEGFPYQQGMEEAWAAETNGNIAFDDWIRDQKAREYFTTHSLPGADWIGWCVLPNQEILTSGSRFVLANDIKLDQFLTTLQGENKVEQIFKRETTEEITTIKVHHNDVYQMVATNNHFILAIETQKCKYNLKPESVCTHMTTMWKCNFCTTRHYESYSAKWIPIKDVTTDMYLPVPLLKHSEEIPIFDIGLLDCFPDNTIVDTDSLYPSRGIRKPMKRNIVMDEATCWLIGYYLAEGNVWAVKDRMRGIQFTAHVNEVSILELAQKIIKDRFGLDSIIRFKKDTKSESAYLVVASGLFGWLMNYWVGRFCDKKFAPIWLEDITYECQIAILDGLNTGDSTKDERTHLALANRELCYMAKRIYETQGIPASLHGPYKRNGKDQYSTRPLKSSLAAIVGSNFIAYRIEEIKKSEYKGTVFDFEVKDEHMYCSPVGIYHNSPAVDMEDVKMQYVEQAGLDYHDFDLWGQREQALSRKPYVNPTMVSEMQERASYESYWNVAKNTKNLASLYGKAGSTSSVMRIEGGLRKDSYSVDVRDGREKLVNKAYDQLGA